MINNTIVHETIIRDIVDLINTGIEFGDEELPPRRSSFKSITSATKGLTLVYPLLVDRALNIKTCNIVAKALERKCVTMLQMLFSAVCISDSKDAFDHVRKYHNNLDMGKVSIDTFMDMMDDLVDEGVATVVDPKTYTLIKEDMRNLNINFKEDISESSIMDYKVSNNRGMEFEVIKEAPDRELDNYRVMQTANKDASALLQNQILNSDIRKSNELMPTMMIVRFNPEDSRFMGQFVIGVKVKLYPVESQDIVNRMIVKNQDKQGLLQFIKASTREISFLKDFVFAIDRAKLDALSQSKRGSSSQLWKVLERRSVKSKIKRSFFMNNDASAITSLLVSQDTIEYIKKTDGLNLEYGKSIIPIMDAYNLMSFIIADETLETTKWLWDDGTPVFDVLPFSSLEKEASDQTYKKVVNLMTKINR